MITPRQSTELILRRKEFVRLTTPRGTRPEKRITAERGITLSTER
jgi:hypothetical protein